MVVSMQRRVVGVVCSVLRILLRVLRILVRLLLRMYEVCCLCQAHALCSMPYHPLAHMSWRDLATWRLADMCLSASCRNETNDQFVASNPIYHRTASHITSTAEPAHREPVQPVLT